MRAVIYSFSLNYSQIMNGSYSHDLFKGTNHEVTISIFKSAMVKFVFNINEILKLELSTKSILDSLLSDFIYAVIYFEDEDDNFKLSKVDKKLVSTISENCKDDYRKSETDNSSYDYI